LIFIKIFPLNWIGFFLLLSSLICFEVFQTEFNWFINNFGEGWVFSSLKNQGWIGGCVFWKILLDETKISSISNNDTVAFELFQLIVWMFLISFDFFVRLRSMNGFVFVHLIVETKNRFIRSETVDLQIYNHTYISDQT